MNDDDHTLLARIDERVSTLIESQNRMEIWMTKQDERICQLEACQNKTSGRDVAIGIISAFLTTIGALAAAIWSGLLK